MRDFSKTTSNDLISLVATGDADAIKELRRQMAISDGLIESFNQLEKSCVLEEDGGWTYLSTDIAHEIATECLWAYRKDLMDAID